MLPEPVRSASSKIKRRLRQAVVLTFPGVVSALAVLPVVSLGALAFAIRSDISLTTAEIGAVFAAFFLCSALFAGIGGWLTTRFTNATIVRACVLGGSGTAVVLATAETRATLFAAVVLAGMLNGVVNPPLNILITRLVPVRRRGLAFGIKVAAVPAAASAAAVGAYAVATLDTSWHTYYWVSAALGVVVAIASPILGPEGEIGNKVETRAGDKVPVKGALIWLGVGGLLGSTGTAVLAPFVLDGLIAQGKDAGDAAALLGISSWLGVASRVLVGAASDRAPKPLAHLQAAAGMLLAGSVGMVGLAVGGSDAVLVGATLVAFGLGWSWPGLLHHATLATHPENPARATSSMQTGTFLGAVIGPLAFGLVAEYVSFSWAWSIAAATVFFAATLLLVGVRQLGKQTTAAPGINH